LVFAPRWDVVISIDAASLAPFPIGVMFGSVVSCDDFDIEVSLLDGNPANNNNIRAG
jgi:hypothetical protein